MKVKVSDKRIKEMLGTKRGEPIKGLQPSEGDMIRLIVSVLKAANNLFTVRKAHPEWRVHPWKGSRTRWSIDVTGGDRLLFNYDKKSSDISKVEYDNPH